MRTPPQRNSGFTVIELMVTVMLLGILLGIGIPSFQATIRNNRTTAQANDVTAALTYARSEATKRGLPVTICAADTARTGCAGATASNWANGWLIFVDAGGTAGVLDTGSGDVLLQTSPRVTTGLQLSSNNLGFLRYGRSGQPTNTGGAAAGAVVLSLGLQHQSCTGTDRRVIAVVRTGRPNLTKTACT
jgi:type IV fimbrial biogenesis protein FimT